MNATAVRKFCTLQEAAERLNTTPAHIEKLLSKGLLREFRDGPHRLLRTADVGAILAARTRRLERQGQPLGPDASRLGLPRGDGARTADPEDTTLREVLAQKPRTPGRVRPQGNPGPRVPGNKRPRARTCERPRLSDASHRSRRRAPVETAPAKQNLSIREWFWSGLLQDRPIAIALLSAIVLLALSGLVAGACWLAETLR